MRDFIRKPTNWFIVMIVVAVLSALIISFFASAKPNLPSYVGTSDVEPAPSVEPTVEIETQQYVSDEYGFSMSVPADWVYALHNGCDSYINAVDGAIISFEVGDYDPTLNMVTAEDISADVAASNGLLGSFSWLDNSSYIVVYEIGSTDYFELSTWDLSTLVRVSANIPAERYMYYRDDILALMDSFVWEKPYPIPEGYVMYYSDYGHFECPIPDTWSYSIVDGALVAMSEDGMQLQIALTSSTEGLSDIAQYDYANAMGSGKLDYMLTSYSVSETVLSAESYFTTNGIQYAESHNILATGEFHYELLFDCPYELIDVGQIHNANITQYFRVF